MKFGHGERKDDGDSVKCCRMMVVDETGQRHLGDCVGQHMKILPVQTGEGN